MTPVNTDPGTSAIQIQCTTWILDLEYLVRPIEYDHVKIFDITSNTCLCSSERVTLDPNSWGARSNSHRGNILFLDFFVFVYCRFRLLCENLEWMEIAYWICKDLIWLQSRFHVFCSINVNGPASPSVYLVSSEQGRWARWQNNFSYVLSVQP